MEIKKATVLELAQLINGEVEGDSSIVISGVSEVENAVEGNITFIAKAKNAGSLEHSKASVAIIPKASQKVSCTAIRVEDPYLAIAIIHNYFLEKPFKAEGIHPSAVIGENCSLDEEVTIKGNVWVGDRVTIGACVCIDPGVVIEDDVQIDDGSHIRSNCTIGYSCKIGKNVIMHSGVVIGSDGFGYATTKLGEHVKRPQVGNVIIEDDVEIGANSCVDRATFGVTLIKKGTKIDNLVQVAHNVQVGENSIVVSQAGIAGSTTLGRNVVLGGQVGVSGHITLGDQVMVGGKSGVHNNVPEKTVVSGVPAINHKVWLRASAVVSKLPELAKDVKNLKKEIAKLLKVNDA